MSTGRSHHRLVVRGGAMFWLHFLVGHGIVGSSLVILVVVGAEVLLDGGLDEPTVLPLLALATWTLIVLLVTLRVRLVITPEAVLIGNGWYTRRLRTSDVARITKQHLPLGAAGRGWDGCLAIWADGAEEGWPALATIRYSHDQVDRLAHEIALAVGSQRGKGRVRVQTHISNRGWRRHSFRRR